MNIIFEKLSLKHQLPVMEIYNHYVRTTTAAFPSEPKTVDYFNKFLEIGKDYPAFAVKLDENLVIGFCLLSAYSPHDSFRKTAYITYFIDPKYTGLGIGSKCLEKLEHEARSQGIHHIVATVSSENLGSIQFHKKHGFIMVGELQDIGSKFGRSFGEVILQKTISE